VADAGEASRSFTSRYQAKSSRFWTRRPFLAPKAWVHVMANHEAWHRKADQLLTALRMPKGSILQCSATLLGHKWL
jgi:hypothetical protein